MKSGYIFVTPSFGLQQQFFNEPGQVHGAAFRALTGESISHRFVASGFARVNGVWKWNSASLASPQCWDGQRAMNYLEQIHVATALNNWINSDTHTYWPYVNPASYPR